MRPNPLAVLIAAALTLSAAPIRAQTVQRADVEAAASALQAEVLAWRRDIHAHPELGNRETRTSKLVADHLRKLGLEVKTGVATTGVVAVLKGALPGPRVALRADMDALPVTERVDVPFASKVKSEFRGEPVGVMHACGHDAHTAILMGVAEALAKMQPTLKGEVLFVFQPAEEGPPDGEPGGATEMLKEGIFRDFKPDAVFGLHVFSTLSAGQIGVRQGPLMAGSDRFSIKMIGRQTHGARPWGGIDPIVASAELITSAQSIVSRRTDISRLPAVVTFGAIKGGVRYNIIPDEVDLLGTIRTFDDKVRQSILADLKNLAEHVAAANGARVETHIPEGESNLVTLNDPALTARMLPSLQAVAGKDNVIEPALTMGSEDFSYFAREAPAMYFFVGATPKGRDPEKAPSNHSPEFFLDESALDLGLRAMLQVTLDYLDGGKAKS
ncbi:MAG: amidohydrolase [Luteimonas sp.]